MSNADTKACKDCIGATYANLHTMLSYWRMGLYHMEVGRTLALSPKTYSALPCLRRRLPSHKMLIHEPLRSFSKTLFHEPQSSHYHPGLYPYLSYEATYTPNFNTSDEHVSNVSRN
jgi:hypothetical protein